MADKDAENVHKDERKRAKDRQSCRFLGLNPRHGSGLSVPDDDTTTQSKSVDLEEETRTG